MVCTHLQLVVSDHGMTENGNHGGSTFEETDSMALFIGPTNFGTGTPNKANQVLTMNFIVDQLFMDYFIWWKLESLAISYHLRVSSLCKKQLFLLGYVARTLQSV